MGAGGENEKINVLPKKAQREGDLAIGVKACCGVRTKGGGKMREMMLALLSGSAGAALVTGVCSAVQYLMRRGENRTERTDAQRKALRYIMLYIIQERAKEHLREKTIELEERRSLHRWHDLYHDGLGGNGDADTLMRQVDALPLRMEEQETKHAQSDAQR